MVNGLNPETALLYAVLVWALVKIRGVLNLLLGHNSLDDISTLGASVSAKRRTHLRDKPYGVKRIGFPIFTVFNGGWKPMGNCVSSKFFKNGFGDGLNMRLEVGNELGFYRISPPLRQQQRVQLRSWRWREPLRLF